MSVPGASYMFWHPSSIRRKDLAGQSSSHDTVKALSMRQIGKPQMRQLVRYGLFEFDDIGHLSYVDEHYLVFDVCDPVILVSAGSSARSNLTWHIQNFTGSH